MTYIMKGINLWHCTSLYETETDLTPKTRFSQKLARRIKHVVCKSAALHEKGEL